MTKLEAALVDLGAFLDERRLPHMTIGGFANLYWGVERFTRSSAEDLIIHKLASERPQDAVDVEGIIMRQGPRLDLPYLEPLVRQLATGLERPEIVETLAKTVARASEVGRG